MLGWSVEMSVLNEFIKCKILSFPVSPESDKKMEIKFNSCFHL